MNPINIAFRLLLTSLVLCSSFLLMVPAQTPTPSPSPSQQATKPDDKQAKEENPFAPEPAPTLPPGMTGSDTNDPRSHLKAGMYDAGEAALGIKHLMLLKKPDAFQLGAKDPNDPKVQKVLGMFGANAADLAKIPKTVQLVTAQLAFAHSDLSALSAVDVGGEIEYLSILPGAGSKQVFDHN